MAPDKPADQPEVPPQEAEGKKTGMFSEPVVKSFEDTYTKILFKEGADIEKDPKRLACILYAMGITFGVAVSANTLRSYNGNNLAPDKRARAMKIAFGLGNMIQGLIPHLLGPGVVVKKEPKEEPNGG